MSRKQGITSILAPDSDTPKVTASSLRRTLSADMLSRKWIAQEHRLSDIADSPLDGPDEESESEFDIWNSIQEEKNKAALDEPKQSDIWSSILSQKGADQPVPAAPYVPPVVKRTASSLSEKSLEVCTESLGSETGSDGFSSYPSSETGDGDEDKEEFTEEMTERVLSPNSTLIGRKRQLEQLTRSRPFPPPLPSLSRQNGASLHVRSRRDNGRLVLEAVSVKEQNNFRAQREDGRLVLTFIDHPSDDHDDGAEINDDRDEEDMEETDDGLADEGAEDDNEDEEIEDEDVETEETGEEAVEELPKISSVNEFAILMSKPVVLANPNPVISNRFGKVVLFDDMEEETVRMEPTLAQLTRFAPVIAKQPTVTTTSYANTYEYLWRSQPTTLINPTTTKPAIVIKSYNNYVISEDAPASDGRQELVVLRGNNASYVVPFIHNCKDTRRSLLFLGHRCIATS